MCSQSIELRESIAPWGALNRRRRHPNLPSSDGMSLENNWGLRSYHSKHVRMTSELAKVVVSIFWKGRWAHANVITVNFRITSGSDPRKTESLWRQTWNCNRKPGRGRFLFPAAVSCAGSVISAAEHETCFSEADLKTVDLGCWCTLCKSATNSCLCQHWLDMVLTLIMAPPVCRCVSYHFQIRLLADLSMFYTSHPVKAVVNNILCLNEEKLY